MITIVPPTDVTQVNNAFSRLLSKTSGSKKKSGGFKGTLLTDEDGTTLITDEDGTTLIEVG